MNGVWCFGDCRQSRAVAEPAAAAPAMDSSSVLIEEQKLQTEPKYRAYMANIDKALKNFEYSSEWADLISALGKLNKVSAERVRILLLLLLLRYDSADCATKQ